MKGRATRFPGAGALVLGASCAGMFWAPFALDVLLGLGGLAAASVGVWLGSVRRTIDTLPLVLSSQAVAGRSFGQRVALVRAWKGVGQTVRVTGLQARIRTEGGAGHPVALSVPTEPRVGPWMVLVPLGEHRSGDLSVRVKVDADHRSYEAEGVYSLASMRPGRFASPLRAQGRRQGWDREAWDRVEWESDGQDTA